MNRSDCTPRDGTRHLTVSAAWYAPSRPQFRAVSGRALPRSAWKPQIGLVPPFTPGIAWPVSGYPPDSIPGPLIHPGFDANHSFRCFISGELSSPSRSPADVIKDAFSSTLTTTVFNQCSLRCFEASPQGGSGGPTILHLPCSYAHETLSSPTQGQHPLRSWHTPGRYFFFANSTCIWSSAMVALSSLASVRNRINSSRSEPVSSASGGYLYSAENL